MSEPKLLRALYVDDNNTIDLSKSSFNATSNPKIKSLMCGSASGEAITSDIFIFSPTSEDLPTVVNGKILIRYEE